MDDFCGFEIPIDFKKGVQEIRLKLKNIIEINKGERSDIQHLEGLQLIQHLTHLTRLQRLQGLQGLHITNKSYEEVNVQKNSVIYCDPPYIGAEEYKEGGFDHEIFYKWCIENPNPVFISEYRMPDDFELVASFDHKSTLSHTNNDKKVIENLYWNKKNL